MPFHQPTTVVPLRHARHSRTADGPSDIPHKAIFFCRAWDLVVKKRRAPRNGILVLRRFYIGNRITRIGILVLFERQGMLTFTSEFTTHLFEGNEKY